MNGIVNSAFKGGTGGHGGCDGWVPSGFYGSFDSRSGLSGDFPTIFVLYLNDLPSESLSLTPSISSLL